MKYKNIRKAIEFEKREAEQELFGPVYRYGVLDTQGDYTTKEELAKAVKHFNTSGALPRAIDLFHNGEIGESVILESYLAKDPGTGYRAGDWLMTVRASDSDWALVQKGDVKAFSMAGNSSRTETTFNGKTANELSDLKIKTVSLVAKGANKSTFVAKADPDEIPNWAKTLIQKIDDKIENFNGEASKTDERGDYMKKPDGTWWARSGGLAGGWYQIRDANMIRKCEQTLAAKKRLGGVTKQESFSDYADETEIQVRLELLNNRLFNDLSMAGMPEYERLDILKEIDYWQNELRVLRALEAMEA